MEFAELEEAVLQLDSAARARLAERLLRSLEELSEEEIEALWTEEAERRDRALDTGELQAIPAEEVFRNVRARLG